MHIQLQSQMETVHILKVRPLKQTKTSSCLLGFFFLNLRCKLYSFNVEKLINLRPSDGLFVECFWFLTSRSTNYCLADALLDIAFKNIRSWGKLLQGTLGVKNDETLIPSGSNNL